MEGTPERDAFPVTAGIGRVPHPVLGTVWAARPDGKPSRSEVRVLERGASTRLVEVSIETGRQARRRGRGD